MSKPTNLTSPTRLDPFDTGKKSLRVVIETLKGSRNKFKYDENLACFRLNKVLPEGMSFPWDFGFVAWLTSFSPPENARSRAGAQRGRQRYPMRQKLWQPIHPPS